MQQLLFPLNELSAASKFYRSISTSPAGGTAFCQLAEGLAEISLTAQNLRRLEPLPENQLAYVSGPASYSQYHVWLTAADHEPLYIGAFNVPNYGLGTFYVVVDPENVNGCGLTLGKFAWLIVTASPGVRHNLWPGELDAGVLYSRLTDTGASPFCLFDRSSKKLELDDDLDDDADFDEDSFNDDPPDEDRFEDMESEEESPEDGEEPLWEELTDNEAKPSTRRRRGKRGRSSR